MGRDPRRAAFSLAELMIAIVILGIGLLTIAAMFPIAWTRARDLAETTNRATITDSAHAKMRLLSRVNTGPGFNGAFLGDDTGVDAARFYLNQQPPPAPLDPRPVPPPPISTPPPDGLPDHADYFVHALVMENMSAEPPASPGEPSLLIPDVWSAISTDGPHPDPEIVHPAVDAAVTVGPERYRSIRRAWIAFNERWLPPLPMMPDPDLDPDFKIEQLRQWEQLLRQRRMAWSALYKFDFDPTDQTAFPRVGKDRTLTLYYVALRRGQPEHRYPRQDPTTVPLYGRNAVLLVDPVAMPAEEDVVLPVPWRLQIRLVDSTASGAPSDPYTISQPGVPAQAEVVSDGSLPLLTADLMPRGTVMVDEITGDIYRVVSVDRDVDEPESALLTLDAPVMDQPINPSPLDRNGNAIIDQAELLRTVWLYPPAIERDAAGKIVGIAGPSPVVGIELRRMTFRPDGTPF